MPDASVRRVVEVVRDSPAGDSDARARGAPAFRSTGRRIETWLGVSGENSGGRAAAIIDFKVGQNFGEPQACDSRAWTVHRHRDSRGCGQRKEFMLHVPLRR